MDLLNYFTRWWWRSTSVNFYFECIYNRLDTLESKIDKLYQKVIDDTSSNSSESGDELTIENLRNHNQLICGKNNETADSESDYDTDGSNLAIYIKPSFNNTTRLQYVMGHREKFETRKRMYDSVAMEKLYEEHGVEQPNVKVARMESKLINAGVRCEYSGKNGIVAYADDSTVKKLVKEHI